MSDVVLPPNCQPIDYDCNNNELIKRLKALSEALQEMDNVEETGENPYKGLAEHLANSRLLDNSHKDVQLWLASCLADLFRISAPNNPINDSSKLKDILLLFARGLKGLECPESPVFRRHFYLLEVICTLNTFNLCIELPSEESCVIIRQVIKTFLEVMRGKGWAREYREKSEDIDSETEGDDKNERRDKMISLFVSTMTKLLGGVDQISTSILDTIFFYLINPQKSNYRESYNLARLVVQATYSALAAPVDALLTKSLVAGGLPKECELVGASVSKLHEVIIEMHEAAPELVAPVIPQVGSFLSVDDEVVRLAATRTIGVMIRNPRSKIHEEHPNVWQNYLRRFKDCYKEIRLLCAKQAGKILLNHSQLRRDVCDALCFLLSNQEDDVRSAALNTAVETAKTKLEAVSEKLILDCCSRFLDKKPNIRIEALNKLLHLHSAVVRGDNFTPSDVQVVSIIPQKALTLYLNRNVKEERMILERLFDANIVPFRMEVKKRMAYMADLFQHFNSLMMEAFIEIIQRNAQYRRYMREIMLIVAKDDTEKEYRSRETEARIQVIASMQSDAHSFSQIMKSFVNFLATDLRAFELVQTMVGTEYTTAKLEECGRTLFQKVAENKTFNKESSTVVRHFIERFSPMSMDNEAAVELVRIAVKADGDFRCAKIDGEVRLMKTLRLLRTWAENYPHLFATEEAVSQIKRLLDSDTPQTVTAALQVLIQIAAQASLKVSERSWYEDILKTTMDLIYSDNPEFGSVTKYALKLLCRLKKPSEMRGPDGLLSEIYPKLAEHLRMEDPLAVNSLRALTVISEADPDHFSPIFENIVHEEIITLFLNPAADLDDNIEIDDNLRLYRQQMPKYTMTKVFAMKFAARVLNGHAYLDVLAKKMFGMFEECIKAKGDLHNKEDLISSVEKAMIRAVAASSALKLSYIRKYALLLKSHSFSILATLAEDPEYCVRNHFIQHLATGLKRNKLTTEFFGIFVFAGFTDPTESEAAALYRDTTQKQLNRILLSRAQYVKSLMTKGVKQDFIRCFHAETAVAYAICLIAQKSEEDEDKTSKSFEESLVEQQEAIWFLLERFVANKEHFDFELIYKSLEAVRQSVNTYYREMMENGEVSKQEYNQVNKRMWALADLAMTMIIYRAKIVIRNEVQTAGDDTIEEVKLLSLRFFTPVNKANTAVYAPSKLIEEEQKRNGKVPDKHKGKKQVANNTTTRGRGRGRGAARNTTRQPRTVKKVEESDEEDDKSESEEENESDEEVIRAPAKRNQRKTHAKQNTSDHSTGNKSDQEPTLNGFATKSTSGNKKRSPIIKPTSPTKSASSSPTKHVYSLPNSAENTPKADRSSKKSLTRLVTARESLENIGLSPIVTSTKRQPSSSKRGVATSTPMPTASPRKSARSVEKLPSEEKTLSPVKSTPKKKTPAKTSEPSPVKKEVATRRGGRGKKVEEERAKEEEEEEREESETPKSSPKKKETANKRKGVVEKKQAVPAKKAKKENVVVDTKSARPGKTGRLDVLSPETSPKKTTKKDSTSKPSSPAKAAPSPAKRTTRSGRSTTTTTSKSSTSTTSEKKTTTSTRSKKR